MKRLSACMVAVTLMAGCHPAGISDSPLTGPLASDIISPDGQTVAERFNPPPGYHRVQAPAGSYTAFLRSVPLKKNGTQVHYYDGGVKNAPGVCAAVLNYDVGTRDLQQCADAVMRIRAEYLFAAGKAGQIHFNLTNGFRADFAKWMQGFRIVVAGNRTSWTKSARPSGDHNTLRAYLDFVYTYAGTLSLSKELTPVAWEDMQPGDVLIKGGSPGHAETVMDVAVNSQARKVFLLSQGFMPAQDIHMLHNPLSPTISPWYELQQAPYTVRTPEYDFSTGDLMRWAAH